MTDHNGNLGVAGVAGVGWSGLQCAAGAVQWGDALCLWQIGVKPLTCYHLVPLCTDPPFHLFLAHSMLCIAPRSSLLTPRHRRRPAPWRAQRPKHRPTPSKEPTHACLRADLTQSSHSKRHCPSIVVHQEHPCLHPCRTCPPLARLPSSQTQPSSSSTTLGPHRPAVSSSAIHMALLTPPDPTIDHCIPSHFSLKRDLHTPSHLAPLGSRRRWTALARSTAIPLPLLSVGLIWRSDPLSPQWAGFERASRNMPLNIYMGVARTMTRHRRAGTSMATQKSPRLTGTRLAHPL